MPAFIPEVFTPLPNAEFDEQTHRYKIDGHWVQKGWSVTNVIRGGKPFQTHLTPKQLDEACNRGTAVHHALELFHQGIPHQGGKYKQWIESATKSSFWQRWQPIENGVEVTVYDPTSRIAGRCDAILQCIDPESRSYGEVVICDYKSKSKGGKASSKKDKGIQLAAYVSLMERSKFTPHFQLSGKIARGVILDIYPDRVDPIFIDRETFTECYLEWESRRENWVDLNDLDYDF